MGWFRPKGWVNTGELGAPTVRQAHMVAYNKMIGRTRVYGIVRSNGVVCWLHPDSGLNEKIDHFNYNSQLAEYEKLGLKGFCIDEDSLDRENDCNPLWYYGETAPAHPEPKVKTPIEVYLAIQGFGEF